MSQDDLRIETDRANVLSERAKEIEADVINQTVHRIEREARVTSQEIKSSISEMSKIPIINVNGKI